MKETSNNMRVGNPAYRGELELRSKIKWLVLFRIAIVTVLLGANIVIQLVGEAPAPEKPLLALYYVIGAIYASSTIYAIWLRFSFRLIRLAYVQCALDSCFITAIIYITGGVESIFTFLYIFSIFAAAILLGWRGAFIFASANSICYGVLVDLQFYELIRPFMPEYGSRFAHEPRRILYIMLVNISAFYVVAFLSSHLQGQLVKVRLKLNEQRRDLMDLAALNDRILQSINSGLLTLDRNGLIVSLNRAGGKILGYSLNEILQQPLAEVIPELANQQHAQEPHFNQDIIRSREELFVKNKEGKRLCLGFSVSPLTASEGHEIGKIVIFQDITEINKMREEVKKLERLAMMGNLAAGMAHEIKNPLGSMSGAFQMLRAEKIGSPLAERLTALIEREINRLNQLLNEFLWLSKPIKKEVALQVVPFGAVVDETITLIRSRVKMNGKVEFQKNIPPDFEVYVDDSQFRQVLWNLLLNGLEGMDYRGGTIHISGEKVVVLNGESQERSFCKVIIQDTGKGIPLELRDQIFEPFFTTKENGTGLGLAIVQQIVESHGGHVQVDSSNEQGTVFSIYLPDLE
jgi:two-component system sensor histidine kinase PilS (NtrC family)